MQIACLNSEGEPGAHPEITSHFGISDSGSLRWILIRRIRDIAGYTFGFPEPRHGGAKSNLNPRGTSQTQFPSEPLGEALSY